MRVVVDCYYNQVQYAMGNNVDKVIKMVGTDLVQTITKLVLASSRVKHSDNKAYLSLLEVANKGYGKSSELTRYSELPRMIYVGKTTALQLIKSVIRNADEHQHQLPEFLIVEDLSSMLRGNPHVVGEITGIFNSLTETGLPSYDSKFIENGGVEFTPPLKMGLLSGMTKDDWMTRRDTLGKWGFTDRFIKFFYSYSEMHLKSIRETNYGAIKTPPKIKFNLPKERVDTSLDEKFAEIIASNVPLDNIRMERDLELLLRSSCIIRETWEVDMEDVKIVQSLMPHLIEPKVTYTKSGRQLIPEMFLPSLPFDEKEFQ